MLQVTFDAATLTVTEASALVAFLSALHPATAPAPVAQLELPLAPMAKSWDLESLRAEALKYETRMAFSEGASQAAYLAAHRLGVLDLVCAHMAASAPPVPAAPVAASAPPVPAAPVAPAPAGGIEVDSAGVPWNPDLHAGNKARKQDGTWKARRGSGTDAPPVPAAPAAASAPPVPAAPAAPVATSAPPVPAAPAAPVATSAPPVPAAPAGGHEPADIIGLAARVAATRPGIYADLQQTFGMPLGDLVGPNGAAVRPTAANYLRGLLV